MSARTPALGRRVLLPIVLLAVLLMGFIAGQQYQSARDGIDSRLLALPGVRDYEALAYYNHYSIVRAFGPSMQPALATYNFVLVRDRRRIQRGDILVSGHHGMHRVVGLPGETVWLIGGRVRVCTPRTAAVPYCRFLVEPWVHFRRIKHRTWGPLVLRNGYATVPDNRYAYELLIFVPDDDVIGVAAGSLLSYGALSPFTDPATGPLSPTLVFEH